MKKSIQIIIAMLIIAGIVINPALALTIAVVFPTTFYVGNKIMYKNKNSELFAIDRKNKITQKVGINVIKGLFLKDKSDYFKKELVNLLIDLESGKDYTTQSQTLVLMALRKLEKDGVIENLKYEELKYKSKFSENINNFFVNIGMGNYSNLFKGSKKYNMEFSRTNNPLEFDMLQSFITGSKDSLEDPEFLDFLPPDKRDIKRKQLLELKRKLENIETIQKIPALDNVIEEDNIKTK